VTSDAAQLIGRWELIAWTGQDEDGAAVRHGGSRPQGSLIYLADGWMAVQIQYDDRSTLGSRELGAGTEADRARAYGTYNAYCGRWTIAGDGLVVHHVELSIHPDQPGMEKRREYELDGDELVLRTQTVEVADGREASSELRWRRVG
jgi:hypothetical protein